MKYKLLMSLFLVFAPGVFAFQIKLNSVNGDVPSNNPNLPATAKIIVGPTLGDEVEATYFLLKHLPTIYTPMSQKGVVWGGVLYYRPQCGSEFYILSCPDGAPLIHNYQMDINVLKAPDVVTCQNAIIQCRYTVVS